MCFSAEADIQKHYLKSTLLCLGMQKELDELCDEYWDIFSLHHSDIAHTKLLAMDTDTRDHPSIVPDNLIP